MENIYLNDILNFTDEEIDNCKISLNISQGKNGKLCLDSWLENGNNYDGFYSYSGLQANFKIGNLCLAFYKLGWSGNQYLFVGAGKITSMPTKEEKGVAQYEPIESLQKYVGRLIIDVYKGNTQGRYNFRLRKFINDCKVVEILPELYGGEYFPGFKNLRLSYEQLHRGIYINRAWKASLQTQKGIYVIVDKAPDSEYSGLGRIYVGKASSDRGMLYDRWKNYADNLTGKNKELELVKKQKGEEYIKKYFQWSLLENFDESTDDSIILEREKYWKLVLNSKNQGLNDNY